MKRIIIALMALLLLVSCREEVLYSSTPKKTIPQMDIIHSDKSSLTMYGDSTGFARLFAKIDSLITYGTGKVNIVHMGGSHVEAGVLTEQLRVNLMSMRNDGRYLDGGPGIMFPFNVARTNTPLGYTSKREGTWTNYKNNKAVPEGHRLGLMGIAVSTTDPKAQAGLVMRQRMGMSNPPHSTFSRMKVLGYSTGSAYPVLSTADSTYVPEKDEAGWMFNLASETDSVIISPAGKGRLTLTGMLGSSDRPGFVVSPVGVNGASLVSYRRCEDLARDLAMTDPDLVILGIGINDASGDNFQTKVFIERYMELVGMIRDINPECAIIFITNNDSCRRIKKVYVDNPNGALAQEAFHSLAKRYDAAVWDLFDVMGGLESVFEWEKQGLVKKDKIHFTNEGYMILGDMLYNAIAEQFDAWKEGAAR